jgi:ABC-2 type transport system permease protein
MIAAASLVADKERGTFEQLLAIPLSLAAIMVGKILPYVGIGFVAFGMMLTGNYLCDGIAVQGSLVLLAVVALGVQAHHHDIRHLFFRLGAQRARGEY